MTQVEGQEELSLKDLFKLVWRCWPYYRPQLKHLITFVLLNSFIGVVYVGGIFIGNDLVENKVLLGERLEPMQATLMFVGEEYVTTGADDEAGLTDEQRQRVALGVLVGGAIIWVLLSAYIAAVGYYMVWIYQRINQQLRVEMLSRAEHLSLQYHSSSRTGDAIYRIYQDSATITNILQYAVLTPIRVAAWLAFGALVLVFFSPWFAPIILVASIIIYLMMRRLLPIVRQKARQAREDNSDLTSRIQENLAAIRVIKANAAEERMMARFERDSQQALDAAYEMRKAMSVLMLGTVLVGFVAFIVAEYFMATWAMSEKATFLGGTFALVGYAVWNLGAYKTASHQGEESSLSAWELASVSCIIQDLAVGLKRAFFLLDLEPGVKEPDQPAEFPARLERVRFENVTFGYEPGQQILRGVNLEAYPGSVTAIVGGTGTGKSTLMSLLLRLYEAEQGSVSINNINLRDFRIADLRANTAIALQQNVLFAQSVGDNIRYGKDDIDSSAVKRAAEVACADEFIMAMPEGYATELGERGGKLSTGQRQRLSIARAVLRDTPILILDEPTASLDAETEQRVIQNLSEWGKDRVVFIITHRLSTIRNADQIAFLEDGVIKELGNHDELIAAQGGYASFVMAESGESSDGDVYG
ncbi:MAG: ABC transporter ATP-binding protein [Woeseiaceae bacterium]